jgi:hypothetical protein
MLRTLAVELLEGRKGLVKGFFFWAPGYRILPESLCGRFNVLIAVLGAARAEWCCLSETVEVLRAKD